MGIKLRIAALAALSFSTAAAAAESNTLIDQQMAGEVDFRDLAFADCYGVPECTVAFTLPGLVDAPPIELTLTIAAERDTGLIGGWLPADLYWDPVDGLGVMGGGQNDEIDFDERMTVTLDTPVRLDGMWMSDMFIYEHLNYGARFSAQDDLEAADVQGFLGEEQVFEARITGEIPLPDDPFNALLGDIFMESGDLLNRALIDEGTISILIRDEEGIIPDRIIRASIGQVDPTKTDIFDGVEVIDIDVTTLLGDAEFAPLLAVGDTNAARILEMIDNPVWLASLQAEAERQRLVSDIPNGEVGAAMSEPHEIDTLVFSAELLTSNDYSVVGFMVAR